MVIHFFPRNIPYKLHGLSTFFHEISHINYMAYPLFFTKFPIYLLYQLYINTQKPWGSIGDVRVIHYITKYPIYPLYQLYSWLFIPLYKHDIHTSWSGQALEPTGLRGLSSAIGAAGRPFDRSSVHVC
jgi:hypothetical protein